MDEEGEFVIGGVARDRAPDEGEIARVIERGEAHDGRQLGAGDDRAHGQTLRIRVMPPSEAVTPGINGWRASDLGQRPAAFLRVRDGFGFFKGLVAGADYLSEPGLIELGGCGFRQRAGMSSGATAMALRLASATVSVEVGVRRVLRPICCRVCARSRRLSSMRFSALRLRAWSLSRVALAPSTRSSSSRIEASRAAMRSRRLV